MDLQKWGREKARARYGSEGMKKMAEGGAAKPPLPISLNPQDHLDKLKEVQEKAGASSFGTTSITINGKSATSKGK